MKHTAALRNHLDGLAVSAHLATSVDDRPHAAPIWFALDDEDDAVWLFTGGRKLANLEQNPRVALSVESADRRGNVDWQATLLGTAHPVDDVDRAVWLQRRLATTYAMHDGDEVDDADTSETTADTETVSTAGLVRIDVASGSLVEF